MTPQSILLGLCAGAISAIVFVSATSGPVLSRFVLFLLTPFSIYLAGLGLGVLPAAIAALTATLAILAITSSPATALVFAISEAAPAAVLSRLALLARGEETEREWYPVGRLVAVAAIFGGLFAVLTLILLGADVAALTKALREVIEKFVTTELPNIPGAPPIAVDQIDEITATTVRLLPAVMAITVMLTSLLSLWLAGRVTLASGRLARPWPDLAMLELPRGASLAFLIALAISFGGGIIGLMAGGFIGAFYFAFALLGLAVAHYVTRGSPWRNFTLSAIYAALFVFSAGTTLVLALMGLGESIFGYRRHVDLGPGSHSGPGSGSGAGPPPPPQT